MKRFLRYDNPLWAFLGALVFSLVYSWSTSPLYQVMGSDSPFFELIGLGITQGKIPYVDLFDHKGPLLFFINALGFSFGIGKTGLFVLQVIFMTATFALLYKLALLFTSDDKRKAFITVLLALLPLVDFITEGNQCEEWMLPFICLSLLLSCRYVLSGVRIHPVFHSLLYGAMFAILFYIRPNDAVMQIGGIYFGLFLIWIVRKEYRQILPNIGAFLGGCVIVSIPLWWYFIARDSVSDFIYGMIIHNLRYTGDALFTWGGIGMILIPAVCYSAIFIWTRKDVSRRELAYIFIPIFVFTVILVGKRDYYHYLIPTVPALAISFAIALSCRWKPYLWTVCVLFAIFSFRQHKCIVRAVTMGEDLKEFYTDIDELFAKVPEDQRNSIWNYNLWLYCCEKDGPHMVSLLGAFVHAGITMGNSDIIWFQEEFWDEPVTFVDKRPEWLVMCPEEQYMENVDYLYENYELVAATPSEPYCEIRLYRLKSEQI